MHVAIVGSSGCGKTTLARQLAAEYHKRGIRVAVLDPFRDKWPGATYVTHNPEHFLTFLFSLVKIGGKWALFIDEASHALDRHDSRFDFIATGARHLGCRAHFMSQRFTMLSPSIRGSCTTWYVFENPDGGKLAALKARPELATCAKLKPGAFYLVQPGADTKRGNIFEKKTRMVLKPL